VHHDYHGVYFRGSVSRQWDSTLTVAGPFSGLDVLLLTLLLLTFRRRVQKEPSFDFPAILEGLQKEGLLIEAQDQVGAPEELLRKSVTLIDEIGSGQFGEVSKQSLRHKYPGLARTDEAASSCKHVAEKH